MKMKKVFDRKKYDSTTAKLIGQCAGEYVDDYDLRLKKAIETQMDEAKTHHKKAIDAWVLHKRKVATEEVDKSLRIYQKLFGMQMKQSSKQSHMIYYIKLLSGNMTR